MCMYIFDLLEVHIAGRIRIKIVLKSILGAQFIIDIYAIARCIAAIIIADRILAVVLIEIIRINIAFLFHGISTVCHLVLETLLGLIQIASVL